MSGEVTTYTVIIRKTVREEMVLKAYERIADSGNERDGGPVYGYVDGVKPKFIEKFSGTVFEQSIENLDIQAVIKAVNGIRDGGRPL